jgi:hypothetical protein
MGQDRGRREQGERDETYAREAKTTRAYVKKELNLFFPRSNKKYLNTIFAQLFKIYIFSFMTMFI